MSEELAALKKELWKVYKTIQAINALAKEQELNEEEKDKLKFLIIQFKSIKAEIQEEEGQGKDQE